MDFETACKKVRELPSCSEKDMEELYGLYKQATVGDNNRAKPNVLKIEEKRKWEAWEAKKGMSSDAAKAAYIKKAQSLL